MKKILSIFTLALAMLTFEDVSGQSLSSIGLRFGGGFYGGSGAEINGRFGAESGRVEGSLAWSGGSNHSSFFLAGVYQIVKPLEGGFDYYYGAGLALGMYSWRQSNEGWKSGGSVGVPVQLGIEYNFSELPLNLSLDLRPIITLRSEGIFVPSSLGLGIRYMF
jgi:hypothetical protein